jgi:hypothetical protein
MSTSKRQRQELSDAMKRRIVAYKDEHPNANQQDIAAIIQQEFNLPVTPGRQTIIRIDGSLQGTNTRES